MNQYYIQRGVTFGSDLGLDVLNSQANDYVQILFVPICHSSVFSSKICYMQS